MAILTVFASEMILRAFNYRPLARNVNVFPESNADMYQLDPVLGYRLAPGHHQLNHFNTIVTDVNILMDNSRATEEIQSINDSTTNTMIHLYGCSNTFGYNLEDSMTMAWKLNAISDYEVANFGSPGYGLLQMFLWIKMNFHSDEIPDLVIINYGAFQDQRSVLSQSWQNSITKFNNTAAVKYPYAYIKTNELQIEYKTPKTHHFYGVYHLAIANCLEQMYFRLQSRLLRERKVTQLLLKEIDELAKKNDVTFILCGIDTNIKTKNTLNWCSKNDIKNADISIDLMNPTYNLMPNDIHPNSLANTVYVQKLQNYLNKQNNFDSNN